MFKNNWGEEFTYTPYTLKINTSLVYISALYKQTNKQANKRDLKWVNELIHLRSELTAVFRVEQMNEHKTSNDYCL